MIATLSGLLVCYLIGSIPTGYLAARAVKGIDIRKHGSGNMGATNVFRVLGPAWGIAVLLIDITKGFIAITVIYPIFMEFGGEYSSELLAKLIFGFAAIAGHNWTIFLSFKGGKGVATTCGVFLAIAPYAVLCALLVWIAAVLVTKYISVASITAAVTCPLWIWLIYKEDDNFTALISMSFLVPVLIIYTHRANIKRLRTGTEHKINDSSKRM